MITVGKDNYHLFFRTKLPNCIIIFFSFHFSFYVCQYPHIPTFKDVHIKLLPQYFFISNNNLLIKTKRKKRRNLLITILKNICNIKHYYILFYFGYILNVIFCYLRYYYLIRYSTQFNYFKFHFLVIFRFCYIT